MFLSVANAWPAFYSLVHISLSELPSAVILDPRCVNSSISSMFSSCSFIGSFFSAIQPHVLGLCYAGFEYNLLCGSGKLFCL